MVDAHHVPPDLQNLLMILVGNKWPTGNQTALRAEANDWHAAATSIRFCTNQVLTAQRLVHEGLEGGTREAFDQYLTGLVGSGMDDENAILPALARCCDSAADSLEELANEIETLRVTIIGCLVVLWTQLMMDAATLWFGGAARAAVHLAACRVHLQLILRRASLIVVTRVTESVLAQVGFNLLAQLIELAEGHRRSLNRTQLRTAAINGAVGGAVGIGAGFAGGILRAGAARLADTGLRQPLGDSLTRLTGTGQLLPAVGKAADLVWAGGYGAVAGMAEGAAQDAVFGLSGDWVAGAANGGFNGAWGTRHSAMNPGNKLSISPADHLEVTLNRYIDPPTRPSASSRLDYGSGQTTHPADDAPNAHQSSTPTDSGGDHDVRQEHPLSDDNDSSSSSSAPGTPHRLAEPNPALDRDAHSQPGTGSDSDNHTHPVDDAPHRRQGSITSDPGEGQDVRQDHSHSDGTASSIWWSAPGTPHRPADASPHVDRHAHHRPGSGSDSDNHLPPLGDPRHRRHWSIPSDPGEDHDVRQDHSHSDDNNSSIWWSAPGTPHRPAEMSPNVDRHAHHQPGTGSDSDNHLPPLGHIRRHRRHWSTPTDLGGNYNWWSTPGTPHRLADTSPHVDRHAHHQPGTGSDSDNHLPPLGDPRHRRRWSTLPDPGEDHDMRQDHSHSDDTASSIWWSAPGTPHRLAETNPNVD